MAGSMLPIFIFLISSRPSPIAKMSSPPMADICETTSGNKKGFIEDAVKVTRP